MLRREELLLDGCGRNLLIADNWTDVSVDVAMGVIIDGIIDYYLRNSVLM